MSRVSFLVVIAGVLGFVWIAGQLWPPQRTEEPRNEPVATASPAPAPERHYFLVHTIGNDENVAQRGLSQSECEREKVELKAVATRLGTYNEALGLGSIVCLPEDMYEG